MIQYKGYYIDHVIFDSKQDIDDFLKERAISAYKIAVQFYMEKRTNAVAQIVDEKAEYLVKHYGFSWDEIEAMEIEAMQNA